MIDDFLELKLDNNDKINIYTMPIITKIIQHVKIILQKQTQNHKHNSKNLIKQYEDILNKINTISQNTDTKTNDTAKTVDAFNINTVSNLCETMHFNGNVEPINYETIDKSEIKFIHSDTSFPPNKYQYIIGRITTLTEIQKSLEENYGIDLYNNPKYKILHLNNDLHEKDWSLFLNDLFIYCSVIYDKQMNTVNKTNKYFGIRLIYDGQTCKSNDVKSTCIATKNELETEYDPVTFRELMIILVIFGLNCFKYNSKDNDLGYDSERYQTYFFTNRLYDSDENYINITNKVKIWLQKYENIEKNKMKKKYMKYKKKYLSLKKIVF